MGNATSPDTALERHASFFDPERTGRVTIGQTYAGLERLGIGLGWRLVLPPIINGFLGYLTQKRATLQIRVDRIADGKHPFDTGVFGNDGAIDDDAFGVLLKTATNGALSAREMRTLIRQRGNRRLEMGKLAGALGGWFSDQEVKLLFCLAADTTKREDGRDVPAVTHRTLRRLFAGTLFHTLARRRRILRTKRK